MILIFIVSFRKVITAINDQYCEFVTCHLPAISTDKHKVKMIEFFTNSPQYINPNIASFVLPRPLEMNQTNDVPII